VNFETALVSSAGGRSENQDAADCAVAENAACWVLADGLGGHGGGATAARMAVATVLASFRTGPECSAGALARFLEDANKAVCGAQDGDPSLAEMRSTAVLLVSDLSRALWAHVGDSRLYYLNGGRIRFQTLDHSVPQAMVSAGEIGASEIRFHEDRNRLLRSLGNRNLRPAVHSEMEAMEPGDAFLLASDGFWEYVYETEMEVDFAKSSNPGDWLRRMEERLIQRATGEHDNYSAIAIFVHRL
jgi:serine/threonine protein phosphatase PrpC